ncbi:hypothetical protein Z517_08385 [Fonsecaea pedrosoi CBS 271.37]|uniref:SMP-30/Gluconolactonase/LRE-like region domain-containing protein n=1 Tax=Fonsecaea pedrosoi CBS 271.37 TaxID=1442368 RepID=A0A0D2EWI7_9EURO|nr:uncharacterized protein Z517_08385 [Fonsecaea pedrosoi CBS 271.37]KIW78547.1 hypothetical protein Z517_08385 [Fonsecaea pedrosoi CBS 271.37]
MWSVPSIATAASFLLLALPPGRAQAQENITGVLLPGSWAYKLPIPFDGPLPIWGNLSTNFVGITTSTDNGTVNDLLAEAQNSTYYAFDEEFFDLFGGQRTAPLVRLPVREADYAYEAAIWLYDRNEVWFTSAVTSPPSYVSKLDLATNKITRLDIPPVAHVGVNGGYYYNGLVYFAATGNESLPNAPAALWSVDPKTLHAEVVVDSYYGLRLNSVDDLTWVKANGSQGSKSCTTAGESNLFFTAYDLAAQGATGYAPSAYMANAVFRFTPETQTLRPVISRADVLMPNGIASDATGQHLFITDTASPFFVGGGSNSSGSSAIVRFDLDADCNPVNKLQWAVPRTFADGIHVDDHGRVWTGEWDGIVVRNARGKVIGVFGANALQDGTRPPIANFALAGDKLVVLAVDRAYVVTLGQTVVTPGRYSS